MILYQRDTLLCSSSKKRTASAHVSSTRIRSHYQTVALDMQTHAGAFIVHVEAKSRFVLFSAHRWSLSRVLPITFSFRYDDINVHVLRSTKQNQTLYTFLYKKATQSESCLDPWTRVTLGWGEDTLPSLLFCPLVAFAIHLCKAVSPLCQRWQIPGHSSS